MDLSAWLDKIPSDLDYEIPTGSHGIVHVGKLCHAAAAEIERLRASQEAAFRAGYWSWAGPTNDAEMKLFTEGCDKSWLEFLNEKDA